MCCLGGVAYIYELRHPGKQRVIGYDDIEFAGLTDVGVRRGHNQDAYVVMAAKDLGTWENRGHVFVVAAGMGAHAVGELASKLAADSIPHLYSKHASDGPVAALRKAFIETNVTIHNRGQQNREFEGMGTTASALVIRPEGVWVGHVGDSRVYRIRNGRIEQLSYDHSLIWELARRQRKSPDQVQGVPSNVIIRSLGPEPLVQVDIEGPHEIKPGDRFVVCSDGLSGPVSDREIGSIAAALPADEACRFLIDLANLHGGPDNITAVVVQVKDSTSNNKPAKSDKSKNKSDPMAPIKRFVMRQWPLLSLLMGIMLAFGAIFLTANELPGAVILFVLSGISLATGTVGLVLQNSADKRKDEAEEEYPAPRKKIHRHAPCTIDSAYLDRVANGIASLEALVRERNGEADWDAVRRHSEEAEEQRRKGHTEIAFREYCRGMQIVMRALLGQRVKEEVFKPLWDKVPNSI